MTSTVSAGAFVGDYEIGGFLGRGTFASVNMATHTKSGDSVAVKIIHKTRMEPAKIQSEVENHRSLCHPNIIKIMEVTEDDDKVCVFMEMASGGDLFGLNIARSKLPENEAKDYFRQISDAVDFCHSNRVAHRDLKPENILLDSNKNVKIADFGLSAKFEWGTPLTESAGSLNYAAPELLQRPCKYQGPEVDVWALGCVLYAMITGTLPFDAETQALIKLIKSGKYRMPGYLSPEAKELISKMLTTDREARASTADLRRHAWLQPPKKLVVLKSDVKDTTKTADSSKTKLIEQMLFAIADGAAHRVSHKIRSCQSFGHVTAQRRASQCSAFGSFARACSMESVVTTPAC